MSANGSFPIGSHVILRRFKNGWQVMSAYPPGYTIPETGMPFNRLRTPDLAGVYGYLLDYHHDDKIAAGHPASKDATTAPGAIPDGSLIDIERHSNSWQMTVDFPSGGLGGRAATYHSISAALDGLKLNYQAV